MDELAKRHSLAKDLELLDTIPGVDRIGATAIVAEIGADMSKFPTDAHISSWAGMSPGNNESAGKKKRKDHVWRHLDKGYAGSMCLISVEDKEYLLERRGGTGWGWGYFRIKQERNNTPVITVVQPLNKS